MCIFMCRSQTRGAPRFHSSENVADPAAAEPLARRARRSVVEHVLQIIAFNWLCSGGVYVRVLPVVVCRDVLSVPSISVIETSR